MVSALSFFQQNAIHDHDFLERIVTGDEMWVLHHFPETKCASLEWKHTGSQRSEKFKMANCAGKLMATVFWERRGVLLADFVEKATTNECNVILRNPRTVTNSPKKNAL
jgi:hypothetical protein